ncbi:MAG: CopG family antitoxin [Thermomicrobiales bacterium]
MNKSDRNTAEPKPQPTVDLGYPTPAYGGIPSFQSIEEEAEFWDTHSILDFPDAIESVGYVPGRDNKKNVVISIRLDAADRARLRAEAQKMGIGPSTLARIWIREKLAG